jgi:hypothetical protein
MFSAAVSLNLHGRRYGRFSLEPRRSNALFLRAYFWMGTNPNRINHRILEDRVSRGSRGSVRLSFIQKKPKDPFGWREDRSTTPRGFPRKPIRSLRKSTAMSGYKFIITIIALIHRDEHHTHTHTIRYDTIDKDYNCSLTNRTYLTSVDQTE